MGKKRKFSRREFLKGGALCACSLAARPLLFGDAQKQSTSVSPSKAPAKSVIQIWLWGGPSQIDTWDPKPNAGYDYCGPLNQPIQTNVDGLMIGQLMPMLAKCADKYAVIRSMTHSQNAHETGSYLVQTGRMPGRHVYPCLGAVVSKFKGYDGGYKGMIPPYIVLTQPQGRFSEAGFLGSKYKPFATGSDPSRTPFEVEGIVARGIDRSRQEARKTLRDELDTLKKALAKQGSLADSSRALDEAYNLILGDAGKVFDLSNETPEIREAYGRGKFACSCLVARRLVESGVPYVTINYNGWDTHKSHFQEMGKMLPATDRALAALICDLEKRGLLESTIVWWSGEFGRTPRVQWEAPYFGGRGHWGDAFSFMVAGGGFKGGKIVGATDERAEKVVERPVYPGDFIGSIYAQMGIDPNSTLTTPQGDVVKLIPESEGGLPSGNLLKEIM